ncbi:unnamed protein product [Amoebophrya sp. A120]|nr:unnamed protein product [Amoebophrya sp. A120]|eukprot:GSA120T00017040001.1
MPSVLAVIRYVPHARIQLQLLETLGQWMTELLPTAKIANYLGLLLVLAMVKELSPSYVLKALSRLLKGTEYYDAASSGCIYHRSSANYHGTKKSRNKKNAATFHHTNLSTGLYYNGHGTGTTTSTAATAPSVSFSQHNQHNNTCTTTWALGMKVLGICRALMIHHPQNVLYEELGALLHYLSEFHTCVDVRDRAVYYLRILYYVGAARMRELLEKNPDNYEEHHAANMADEFNFNTISQMDIEDFRANLVVTAGAGAGSHSSQKSSHPHSRAEQDSIIQHDVLLTGSSSSTSLGHHHAAVGVASTTSTSADLQLHLHEAAGGGRRNINTTGDHLHNYNINGHFSDTHSVVLPKTITLAGGPVPFLSFYKSLSERRHLGLLDGQCAIFRTKGQRHSTNTAGALHAPDLQQLQGGQKNHSNLISTAAQDLAVLLGEDGGEDDEDDQHQQHKNPKSEPLFTNIKTLKEYRRILGGRSTKIRLPFRLQILEHVNSSINNSTKTTDHQHHHLFPDEIYSLELRFVGGNSFVPLDELHVPYMARRSVGARKNAQSAGGGGGRNGNGKVRNNHVDKRNTIKTAGRTTPAGPINMGSTSQEQNLHPVQLSREQEQLQPETTDDEFPHCYKLVLKIEVREPVLQILDVNLTFSDRSGNTYFGALESFAVSFQDLFLPVPSCFDLKQIFQLFWAADELLSGDLHGRGDDEHERHGGKGREQQNKSHQNYGADDFHDKDFDLVQSVKILFEPRAHIHQKLSALLWPFLVPDDVAETLVPEDFDFEQEQHFVMNEEAEKEKESLVQGSRHHHSAAPGAQHNNAHSGSTSHPHGQHDGHEHQGLVHDEKNDFNSRGRGAPQDQNFSSKNLNLETKCVLIFIPPRYHLALRFTISEHTTVCRIRTDRFKLLSYLDAFFWGDFLSPAVNLVG